MSRGFVCRCVGWRQSSCTSWAGSHVSPASRTVDEAAERQQFRPYTAVRAAISWTYSCFGLPQTFAGDSGVLSMAAAMEFGRSCWFHVWDSSALSLLVVFCQEGRWRCKNLQAQIFEKDIHRLESYKQRRRSLPLEIFSQGSQIRNTQYVVLLARASTSLLSSSHPSSPQPQLCARCSSCCSFAPNRAPHRPSTRGSIVGSESLAAPA
jgi:hypothetical protein